MYKICSVQSYHIPCLISTPSVSSFSIPLQHTKKAATLRTPNTRHQPSLPKNNILHLSFLIRQPISAMFSSNPAFYVICSPYVHSCTLLFPRRNRRNNNIFRRYLCLALYNIFNLRTFCVRNISHIQHNICRILCNRYNYISKSFCFKQHFRI